MFPKPQSHPKFVASLLLGALGRLAWWLVVRGPMLLRRGDRGSTNVVKPRSRTFLPTSLLSLRVLRVLREAWCPAPLFEPFHLQHR